MCAACCATRKPPKRRNGNRLRNIRRNQVGESAARPSAGVVDDDIGRAHLALDQAKETFNLLGFGRIAGKGTGAGLGAERAKLLDLAGGEGNLDAFAREQPRQRCAQSFAGTDDQGNLVFWNVHERSPEKTGTWYLGAQSGRATHGGGIGSRSHLLVAFRKTHWSGMPL